MWFLVYKVMATVLIVALTLADVVHNLDGLGWKWSIFLTKQGMLLISDHTPQCSPHLSDRQVEKVLVQTLHCFLTRNSRNRCSNDSQRTRLTLIMKISWALQMISSSIAITVTVLYWSLVYKYVIKHSFLNDDVDWVYNVFFHAFNTLFMVTDLFISARPVSLYHAYLPVIYGLLYSLFSLLYWQAGGGQDIIINSGNQISCL